MKTIKDIRHKNLLVIVEELGSQQALADLLDRSHAQINQLVNQAIVAATGNRRSVSEKMAREIEKKTSKPFGWMDTDHSSNAINVFEKDNELTETQPQLEPYKAEMEILKMQAELAQKEAEIARKEAETAKMQARAEIAEAKLEILKPQAENFQLVRDLLKRTEARLTETEKVLNEMQDKMIAMEKKNNQRVA